MILIFLNQNILTSAFVLQTEEDFLIKMILIHILKLYHVLYFNSIILLFYNINQYKIIVKITFLDIHIYIIIHRFFYEFYIYIYFFFYYYY